MDVSVNLALTVSKISALGQNKTERQGVLYMYISTCLEQA